MSTEMESPSSSTTSLADTRSSSQTSLFSTFAYPVSYTVSGLLRRIAADEAPTPLARALSANFNGSMHDTDMGAFGPPPRRRLSPFQPPPLTPLTLAGFKESTPHKSRLLNKALAEEIRLLIPPRLQLVDTWKLAYSLEQDGTSLASLFKLCEPYRGKRGGFILTIRDSEGAIFGAYLSDPPHPSPHYYGTGECFLWRCFRLPSLPDLSSLPPPPSEDTTHLARMTTITGLSPSSSSTSLASLPPTNPSTRAPSPSPLRNPTNLMDDDTPMGLGTGATTPASSVAPSAAGGRGHRRRESQPLRFKAFPYTGENDFTILCGADFLSVGGGNGKYGLWLDDRLARGASGECETFGNEPLSEAKGGKFGVLGVEVWVVGG
ncbi:TLD-like protein [Elsinoe fawcettii]|nr:TLD-like protein [Elsinoe fawcettii]